MIKRIIVVLMVMIFSMVGSAFASDEAKGEISAKTSITCTDFNTGEVISKITIDSDNLTVAEYAALNSLRSDIKIANDTKEMDERVIVCCVANPPTRRLRVDYHFTSGTKCDLMRQYLTECTKCGAILNKGALSRVNTHTPGSSGCPN